MTSTDELKKLQKYTTSRSQNPFDTKSSQHSRVDRQDAKIKVSIMIDEKQQQSSANNGSNGGEAGKSTTDRSKTRRSLFSVLFHSSSKHKQQQQQQEHQQDDANQANNNSLDIGSDSEIAEFLKKGEEQVTKLEPSEGDSYELELDDRLAIEKSWQGGLTIKNRRSPSPKSNSQGIPSLQTQDSSAKTSKPITPLAATRLPKSPLLEQFLNSHKIQLNSMDSSSESVEIDDDSSGESLHNQTSGVIKKSPAVGKPNDASARDLRLVNWRLMAAKSMWSANSLPSSDSDFDPLDCDSPALVVTCSDDTSCSSVELIWTPRVNRSPPVGSYGFAALELRPSAAQQRHQKHQNLNYNHLLLRPTSGSSGVSLKSAQSDQSVSQLELVKKAEPQKVPDVSVNSRPSRAMQRFSIFELAKPNRAKDKQIGRRRSECRRFKDSNSVQWVANPLFSNDENDEDNEFNAKQALIKEASTSLKRCASHESVVVIKPATLETEPVEQEIKVKVEQDDLNKKAIAEENITNDGKLSREQSERSAEPDIDSSAGSGKDSDNDANDELDGCETESGETADKKDDTSTKPPTTKRDNIYLSHIINLDKRIKSNVSSLKSQISVKLSDTGKRASVLADQLIASIKDTTKETQELFGTTSSRSRRDKSFKTSSKDSTVEPMSDNKKAKLYSLIYMHQQHASGQPVITRQPLPSGGRLEKQHTSTQAQPPPVPPRPSVGLEVQVADVSVSSDSFKSETILEVDKPTYSSREHSNNNIQTISAATKTKLRRRKRARCRPSPAPPPSSDDEKDFYQVEYNKLRNKSQLSKKSLQKRSLNYWRRFRMRQLGLEWKLVREDIHRSLDLTDLLGTANYYDINEDFLYSYRFERTY